ncbi:transposase [Legionella pneumophila serogroup 1]|nr:transposase [Legionella pneumophila subsp. fraseri]MDX1845822.1 transposase [Legionella pneumophila subsp. fraseri]
MLRKRAIVESVIDQLKNISNIEHSRHRSIFNFMVNILVGLAAYALKPKKPSLNIERSFMAVVWSFTDYGSDFIARTMSLITSCRLQSKSAFDAISQILTSHFSGHKSLIFANPT